MENNLQMMMKKQKRRKIWLSTLGIMMCIVVFCTTYALILPAITMEPDTWCGKEEHKHEDECFQEEMICQSHTHGDECYARQSELICAKEEEAGHLHTDACAPLTELILSCGMEESAGHTHTEECEPKTEKNLVCEQEEGEEHTHSEPCYTTIITYGCGLPETEGHTHDDTCYTPVTIYGCGLEETAGHTHGEECYSETTVLTCELEAEEHEHSEACYENQLTCELEEHTHSLACYSDPTADVETAANWEATLPDELTGVYAKDVLAIAESQLGYTESIRNYIVSENGEMQGYTRYGEWYGNPYGDWCAMFASFCLHYAGVEDFPLEASCSKWVADLTEKELYREAVAYEPQPGDLVFFNQDEDEAVDHVGIVVEMIPADGENPAKLRTIEGNSGNRVCEIIYELSTPEEWEKILGYGDINTAYKLAKEKQKLDNPVIQEYLCEIPDHTHSADCLQQEETEYEKLLLETTYENDRLSAVIRVEGIMPLPGEIQGESQKEDNIGGENNQKNEISDSFAAQENDPEVPLETEDESVSDDMTAEDKNETEIESGASNQEPILVVEELDSKNETYQNIAGVDHEGELVDLTVLQIQIQNGDQSIELDDCTITAEIVPSKALMTEILDVCDQMEAHAVEEVETGVHLTALNDEGEETTPGVLVTSQTREAPVMMTRVANNGVLAVSAVQTANPKFTVQYYANLPIVQSTGSAGAIDSIIDTSGRRLPGNTKEQITRSIGLEAIDSTRYKVAKAITLTEVYTSHTFEYITAPNLAYFNRLYENGHYELKEIWILKEGRNAASTVKSDWDSYPIGTHFTNRAASTNNNTVLITDKTVIRLIFDTTDSVYTNAVNFYDYDITNDGIHTGKSGINSDNNYTGSGAKLAFGNDCTYTGRKQESWNGNTLNIANEGSYSGCTFGLATGLSGGKIQYASGVDAPNLFDDGNAIGKTSYEGKYSLIFDRVGDTYTLSSVGGTDTATDLQHFRSRWNWNNTRIMWYNNFWPMDNEKNADPHTGEEDNPGKFIGIDGVEHDYYESDNGIAHNNMFGMTYKVKFTLTEDYSGPLEYLFFGDDDMWVFLDNQLVCDIGGVHSSVGEYVNLRDYLPLGSAGTHTLTFYFTERGLSGSTCYMQFTLPSVSSVTPEQNTGLLTVQKLVEGDSGGDEEFHFEIKFTDANGNNLPDDYSYTRYDKDGKEIKKDIIIYDGGSFDLRAGEYVIINYLPYGTRYTITETDAIYYTTTYTMNGGAITEGKTAKGQIKTGKNGEVIFTNTPLPKLPDTGGSGTYLYTVGGMLLMAATIPLYSLYRKRRKEEPPSF